MSNSRKKGSNFIVQGSILAIAAVISRLIGLLYRIVLVNILGDYGNDYYSAAFSVYNVLLMISSFSLPLAVSKLVSERIARKEYRNSIRLLKGSLVFAVITGVIACLICFFGADFITTEILATPMSFFALRYLAPTLLIVAILGVIRGYFQGLGTMVPTATSQVIEQIVNAVASIVFATMLAGYGAKVGAVLGKTQDYQDAYAASGGTIGTGVGALAALLFLGFVLFTYKDIIRFRNKRDKTKKTESYSNIFRVLILTIIPVVLSTTVYNISDFIDQAVYKKLMIFLGESKEIYSAQWGIYSAEVFTLISIPITIASALSSSVIPTLSGIIANKDYREANRKISTGIRFLMVVSFPLAVGLGVLSSQCLTLIFNDSRELPAKLLVWGAVSVVFYTLSTLMNGVLQGINKMYTPIKNSIIGIVIHVAVLVAGIIWLDWGIYAVAISNIVFGVFMCLANYRSIRRFLHYRQEIVKTFIVPFISSAVMGVAIYFGYKLIDMLIKMPKISTIITICLGAVIYFVLLLVFKEFNKEELSSVPGGNIIYKVAHKLRFM